MEASSAPTPPDCSAALPPAVPATFHWCCGVCFALWSHSRTFLRWLLLPPNPKCHRYPTGPLCRSHLEHTCFLKHVPRLLAVVPSHMQLRLFLPLKCPSLPSAVKVQLKDGCPGPSSLIPPPTWDCPNMGHTVCIPSPTLCP